MHRLFKHQKGFTIVELLIATTVFSVILLMTTQGFLIIGRLHTKTVVFSRTQETARSIVEEISQAIQFSGGAITPTLTIDPSNPQHFCVNDLRLSYRIGHQLVANSSPPAGMTNAAVIADKVSSGCPGPLPLNNSSWPASATNPRELLSTGMRLENIRIQEVPGISGSWDITVLIIYGDEELLTGPAVGSRKCATERKGSEFCAMSEFSTIVHKRL